jgi:hypothetical protein
MIRNATRGTIIASNVRVLTTMTAQARGLMFKTLSLDTAYAFPFNWPRKEVVIMPFVRQPLDLIFLDTAGRVLETCESLKPWHNYNAKQTADMLIEVHEGTIARTNTRIGDKIILESDDRKKDI